MPLIRLSVDPQTGLAGLHGSPQCPTMALHRAAGGAGPIIVMVHGYKYVPNSPAHCPHRRIFDAEAGWPLPLRANTAATLGVCFGWSARGPLARVFETAGALGRELAHVLGVLRRAAPQRPVHVIAHSMGAEVALSALRQSPAGTVSRMILLTGASFQSHAARALSSPAGRSCELFNVTSRENDIFDFAFERVLRTEVPGDRALGFGIAAPNALDIQLDCPDTLDALAVIGSAIAPSQRRVCHWSGYTRPGALAFYARLLHTPQSLPLALLRSTLPATPAPRWSRIPLAGIAKRRIMRPPRPKEQPA